MSTISVLIILSFCIPWCVLSQNALPVNNTDSIKNELIVSIKKVKNSQNEQAAILFKKLAEAYEVESRPDSAVSYYQKSSAIYKTLGKDVEYYAMLEKLGVLYLNLYNYKFAINNLKEATDFYLENKMYRPYAIAMNQLGLAYTNDNQHVDARLCYIKTLEIANDILRDTNLIMQNNNNLIQNDLKEKNYDRALKIAFRNQKLAESFLKDSTNAFNDFYLGKIYFEKKDFRNAELYLERAESGLLKQGKEQDLPELYKILSLVYIETGSKEKVISVLEKYMTVVNNVKNTEILKSSQEIAQKFDSENKDLVIKQLENENELKTLNGKQQRVMIYILIFAFLATILAVYLTYRNYTNRFKTNQIISQQRNELQDQQLKEIEKDSQIKAMESMLMGQEAERNRIGKDLHDSLGAMLSTIKLQMSASQGKEINGISPAMKKAKEMIDDACEEVRKISRDMMPITLSKYGLHTALEELIEKYTFDGGPTVIYQAFGINRISDKDLDLFVFRIVQELVNNSIKHAKAQEIIIQINYLEDLMMITVEDDGEGFAYNQTQYQGMGLKNVEYRAQYLKGKFSVDSTPGNGTIMVVEIPTKAIKHKDISLFNI